MNLGTFDVGQTGVGTVMITNVGKADSGPLVVTPSAGITATGCGAALKANGGNCTLTVSATPPLPGNFAGTISIAANPGTGTTPLQIAVVAQVTPDGTFSVAPSVIDLGPVAVGVAAPKQTITVLAKVAISDLQVTTSGADISVDKVASTCTATPVLAAGGTCIVVVNFTAATSGPKSDTVTISGGGTAGKTVKIPVTATAQNPPKLVVTPTSQQFATNVGQASSAVTFAVANAGDVQTGSLVADVTGANKADFAITSNNCLILAPLGACTIAVTFKPMAPSATPEAANLTVTDSGVGASSVIVPLTGIVYTQGLTVTPATGDLGSVLVGATGTATAFTVTNDGMSATGALTTGVSSTEFVISNDTCIGQNLAPKGTCNISVALKPLSVGAKSATLNISGAAGVTTGKTLTGVGVTPPHLTATPASLDFAGIRMTKTSAGQTVTVKNDGGSITGALSFTKGGTFSAFPMSANGCSAPLGPGASCTFTLAFAPPLTATSASYTSTYTVTDGITSAMVSTSGSALLPSSIDISPDGIVTMGSLVVGSQSDTTKEVDFKITAQPLDPTSGLTDTGAITVALAGTNAADFKINATKSTCGPALQPNAVCHVFVAFAPTVTGDLQATLNVTTANGGSASATLQAKSFALVEVEPVDGPAPRTDKAGLSFGQVTLLGDPTTATMHDFKVHVRGPNSTTAFTSSVLTTLTDPSQPADFSYGTTQLTNPCNSAQNQAVVLNFSTKDFAPGAINTVPKSAQWTYIGTGDVPEFVCTFTVLFYPQSSKGAKTATIKTTGSGNGSDEKTITGTATGALTFNPEKVEFGDNFLVGDSTNQTSTISGVTLGGSDKTIALTNNSKTQSFGPVALTLGGTDADQFWIVADTCSTTTLAPNGSTCYVSLAFAPTSVGAKTATLTATAGTETAAIPISGGASTGFDITIEPDQWVAATDNIHDFGTVPQTGATVDGWTAFTIKNPAGSPRSAQVQFGLDPVVVLTAAVPGIDDVNDAFILADGSNTTTATSHPFGTCGGSGTTTLAAGQSCTFFVQFAPKAADAVTDTAPITRFVLAKDIAKGMTVKVKAQGKVSSIISVTPAAPKATPFVFPDTAESVTSANSVFAVKNNGSVSVTLALPAAGTTAPFNVVDQSGCTANTTLVAGASCNLAVNFVGIQDGASPDPTVLPISVNATASGASTITSSVALWLSGKTIAPAKLVAVGYNNTINTTTLPAFHYTVNMGGVRFGSQSAQVTLWFKNTGSEATDALHYRWSTQNADDTAEGEFPIQSEAGSGCVGKTSLAPGAVCSVTVAFVPNSGKAAGERTATFALSATKGGLVQLFTFKAWALAAGSGWVGIAGGANGFFAFPKTISDTTAANDPKQVFTITNNTGSSQTLALGLTNGQNGTAASEFSIVVDTADATYPASAGNNPCASLTPTLANSASCTFGVVFHPTAWSADTAYRLATVATGLTGTSLGVIGQVQAPAALEITPSDKQNLGEVLVGTSVPTAFTVKNTGDTDATNVAATIASGSHYAVTPGTCTGTLAAGATCTGTVTFAAGTIPNTATAGELLGTLQVTADGVTAVTLDFGAWAAAQTLLGLQSSPPPANTPIATLAFATAAAPQAVGTTSAPQTVYVTNAAQAKRTGLFTLALVDKVNFAIDPVATTCALASDPDKTAKDDGLKGGDACTVVLTFTPKTLPANGTFQTTLTVSESSGATPVVLTVTGYAKSALSAAPSPATVGGGISATTKVVVTLATNAPETGYLKTSIAGANFMIVEDECLMTKLSATNLTCDIQVAFLGTSATPNQTAKLTVSDGGTTGNSVTVTLNSTAP